ENWLENLQKLKTLRQSFKLKYGLLLKTEIHASELIRINKLKEYSKIKKLSRIELLKDYIHEIPRIFSNGRIINICLRKSEFLDITDFQSLAWRRMIQRYDTFLKKSGHAKGIIISDETNHPLINHIMRQMRIYNPIPSHFTDYYFVPTENIVEDLFSRKSTSSYFLQTVDSIAHILYRKEFPKTSLKKYNIDLLFDDLEPILLKEASKNDSLGIVRK
ncbi:MAG: DUF3800 domain-containing protein, partial [Bacteroidales bacterium]|nr:DUF3800 domain-containing protein [Bacteroidales bacterium]